MLVKHISMTSTTTTKGYYLDEVIGRTVEIRFDEEGDGDGGEFYSGQITGIQKSYNINNNPPIIKKVKHFVEFEDGDSGWVNMSWMESIHGLRWPTATTTTTTYGDEDTEEAMEAADSSSNNEDSKESEYESENDDDDDENSNEDIVSDDKPPLKRRRKDEDDAGRKAGSRLLEYNEIWMNHYCKLKQHQKKHGVTIPASKKTKIGRWISTQRKMFTKNRIRPDRKKLLDEIGFILKPLGGKGYDEMWMDNFHELKEYRTKHGHCNVPKSKKACSPSFRLGGWVTTQRTRKNKNKLEPDKIRLLDEIGFNWKPSESRDKIWMGYFHQIKEYRLKHGHCNVPRTPYTKLGGWVCKQRSLHTQNKIRSDRKRMLDEVGFTWRLRAPSKLSGERQHDDGQPLWDEPFDDDCCGSFACDHSSDDEEEPSDDDEEEEPPAPVPVPSHSSTTASEPCPPATVPSSSSITASEAPPPVPVLSLSTVTVSEACPTVPAPSPAKSSSQWP